MENYIMDTIIVIMHKDKKTGFLDRELMSLPIFENEELIVNIFVQEDGNDDNLKVHLRLSTERDLEDWEYCAVFDYYDTDIFDGFVENICEKEDYYNPVWEIIFDYMNDADALMEIIKKILEIHKKELLEVYDIIKDKESEYQ